MSKLQNPKFFDFSRSFEVLANAIGFKKSFSTSDILGIESSAQYSSNKPFFNLNRSHSEIQLSNYAPLFRLEASSRSLSTWVAVGDTSATTQLPSPQVSPLMSFLFFLSVKSPASGKENVWFPDSLDFENLPDLRTGHDVR